MSEERRYVDDCAECPFYEHDNEPDMVEHHSCGYFDAGYEIEAFPIPSDWCPLRLRPIVLVAGGMKPAPVKEPQRFELGQRVEITHDVEVIRRRFPTGSPGAIFTVCGGDVFNVLLDGADCPLTTTGENLRALDDEPRARE